MARVVIDTRPIRNLAGDKSIEGSVYESLLEARERKPDVPVFDEQTTDFTFLRYIGHPELSQNNAWAEEWVNRISDQLSAGGEAFVFCHSPDNLIAPHLCREFHRRISEKVNLPPLPWDGIGQEIPQQPSLF